MDLGLKGKIAIVSASSKGLGKATALKLAMEGANVVILARNERKLKETKKEIIDKTSVEVLAIRADVRKREDIENVVNEAIKCFGTVHILVNNAGGPPAGFFDEFSDEVWYDAIDLLLMSTIRFTRLVLPYMKKQKWGRIINITSISVKQPLDNLILSNSIRLAIIGMAKTLSRQVAPYNITINNVAPGPILTDRLKSLVESEAKRKNITFEEELAQYTVDIPMKRVGKPEELAALIAFLASEKASYITGVTITVDGGMTRFVL
ncbi:MAG TPA: SDR family oxidoreductase [Thermoplasmatales archaeon]|nr:SDR family oxidoreductase [Thermoplasmatales archaeon]HEX08657.1 SDR family oxidoreductase [Thermoplasmatales archaeon]